MHQRRRVALEPGISRVAWSQECRIERRQGVTEVSVTKRISEIIVPGSAITGLPAAGHIDALNGRFGDETGERHGSSDVTACIRHRQTGAAEGRTQALAVERHQTAEA
ncbi:MAG: hypothetical protein KatS3mg058_3003 [Roseiflexus sp.]|nr:MAG: hypothetical protein KatS3mg058_3003 [Roseiflexus sp.]